MPRKKRFYFPVSQEINDDPEVWEFTDRFGLGGLRVLLEYYRILHITENHFQDTEQQWLGIFSKCRVRPFNGWQIRGKLTANQWLMICRSSVNGLQTFCGSPNYWKYHNSPEPEGVRWESLSISISISSSSDHKNDLQKYASPAASHVLSNDNLGNSEEEKMPGKKRRMGWPDIIYKQTDELFRLFPEKYKRENINEWVNHQRKGKMHEIIDPIIAETLRGLIGQADGDPKNPWWGWLDTMIEINEERQLERDILADQNRLKQETADFAKQFFGGGLGEVVKDVIPKGADEVAERRKLLQAQRVMLHQEEKGPTTFRRRIPAVKTVDVEERRRFLKAQAEELKKKELEKKDGTSKD